MNKIIRKALEKLSLSSNHHSKTKHIINKALESLSISETPSVPFTPVEIKKCQAYYTMSEAMRRFLCDNCDGEGHITYSLGVGRCLRYREKEE